MTKTTSRPAAAKSTTAKSAAKKTEKGTDLLAALMKLVEERVEGVERVPNKSQTYTRLEVGGKTFAYVFPPRPAGLLVKIPKQLLAAVESNLPRDHGFKRGEYGLTRTITKASEAPKVAQAFQVAASSVAAPAPPAATETEA